VATLVARNANEAMVEPMVGYGRVCAFGRSLESGDLFCVGAFGRNLASVAVKMFSLLIYFIKKFYKFCTFNMICKGNTAINCRTVQHKICSFPSTLTNHTTLVSLIFKHHSI
jgi:hypothetical protein